MAHHIRPFKLINKALKRRDLDAALEHVWSEEDLHQLDKRGRTSVADLFAADHDFPELVARLLERGITPDMNLGDAFSPMPLLRHCVLTGATETAKLALEHGARVDMVFDGGVTLAHEAAARDDAEILAALHAFGAELDADTADDRDGNRTPLQVACAQGAARAVAQLLACGVDVDAANWRGETPLFIATQAGEVEIARQLIEADASLSIAQHSGRAPLHEAVNQRKPALVSLFLGRGAEVDPRDDAGWTPLHFACARGAAACLELLLEAGADPTLQTVEGVKVRGTFVEQGSDAAQIAAALGQRKIAQLLAAS